MISGLLQKRLVEPFRKWFQARGWKFNLIPKYSSSSLRWTEWWSTNSPKETLSTSDYRPIQACNLIFLLIRVSWPFILFRRSRSFARSFVRFFVGSFIRLPHTETPKTPKPSSWLVLIQFNAWNNIHTAASLLVYLLLPNRNKLECV